MDSIIGIERCSWPDWTIYALYFLLLAGITLFSAIYLKAYYLRKLKHGYDFKKGDMKWTVPKLSIMTTIAFVTGIISGALGLGGGVIFNPLFLELGLHPQVASATGMYLVMFGTLSNSALYALGKQLYWAWGFWQGTFTVIGSILGLKMISSAIKKTGRVSLLVFMLAIVIGVSAIVIPINATLTMIEDLEAGENVFGFKWICD
jgi:uncharacterized membrane protein YfcA